LPDSVDPLVQFLSDSTRIQGRVVGTYTSVEVIQEVLFLSPLSWDEGMGDWVFSIMQKRRNK
jgi:hypothetical protein